jgi:Flp pilus assembly protein CpaB
LSIFRGLSSRRPFTLLGVVLALLVIAAFVLVALSASSGTGAQRQNVVVASRDLQPRIPIDADALEIKSLTVPNANAYFDKTALVAGMIPLVTIPQGLAITSNMVAKASLTLGSQSAYLPIPSGYVALTIPTSEQQGVADYIQPDDYISVIATVSTGIRVATLTVFTQVHVIRVGMEGSSSSTSPSAATSLTVVVTECQAEYITWFLTFASLKYSLESYQDYLHQATPAKDPSCPDVGSAKGVTLKLVQAAYPTLFT